MTKAILFSQRRWNSEGEEALDTIEEYVELINKKGAALWPLWKIKKKSSTNEAFKHKEIKTGYIYSSMYRKNIDAVKTNYMGKIGHKIDIEWIKDGGELSDEDKSFIMCDNFCDLLYNEEECPDFYTPKVFWMKVKSIEEIGPYEPMDFIGYHANEKLKRQPIQYVFVDKK